jgi:acyl-CoA synthetase (NDP forming)
LNVQIPPRDNSGIALTQEGWKALSNPASIALVGASGRSSSVSFTPRFLETNAGLGYRGDIYLINPNRDTILDRKCWRDLSSLPVSPELVIISLPDEKVLPAVHEAIACGARAMMIHSGGFGERGEAGLLRERELQRACGEAGVAALGPNCLGLMNLTTGVSLSSFKLSPGLNKGSVALISQSGSVAGILMHVAGRHGVSFVASTGNEAVTTAEDLIEYAIADPATKLIVCFIEALRRPHALFALAERAHRAGKPIVVLKAGLTEKGGEVSRGHTGALAGSGAIYRQAFEQAGVILVEDFDELAQTVELLATIKSAPRGCRVGMLGTSGGELGNITDLCEELGVELPPFSADTLAGLQDWLVLPKDVRPRNPVDVGTGFNFAGSYEERMRGAIRVVAADPSVDLVVVMQGFHREGENLQFSLNREMMNAAARESASIDKPVAVLACQSGRLDEEVVAEVRTASVPALEGAREGLRALRHLDRYRRFLSRRSIPAAAPAVPGAPDVPQPWENGLVPQAGLFRHLEAAGLPVTRFGLARSADEAEKIARNLGGRVVMKIDTPRVVHKSDIGGVALGVTPQTAAERFAKLKDCISPPLGSEPGEAVFVAEELAGGVEFYVGAKRDATFGTVVVLGMGGRLLEILGQTAPLVFPFSEDDVSRAIEKSGAAKFLSGFRGAPKADLAMLARLVRHVGAYALSFGERLEVLDLNPVIITAEHPGGCIADARLILDKGE